jgi:hypothetical protein
LQPQHQAKAKNRYSIFGKLPLPHAGSSVTDYLKPDFLPVTMTWFEQERIGFELPEVQR